MTGLENMIDLIFTLHPVYKLLLLPAKIERFVELTLTPNV